MAEGLVEETVVDVSLTSNRELLTPEIRSLHPLHLSSILSSDLPSDTRSRTSSAASTGFLNMTTGNNNNHIGSNSAYTDTITSNRSRHLSFSRLSYNLSNFNREFDKVQKEKTNSFLKVVVDPKSLVRTISKISVRPESASHANESEEPLEEESVCSPNASPDPAKRLPSDSKESFCCSRKRLLLTVTSLFPILNWGREYGVRENIVSDVIAGLTIIVFHVPQSMGYSLIAHVSPVYGLYTAFFPALIYSLMGTSKHCAIGMFAVISLMTGTLIQETRDELMQLAASGGVSGNGSFVLMSESAGNPSPELTASGTPDFFLSHGNGEEDNVTAAVTNIRIAVAVSFLIGFYQLVFGILQMGFISVYLSEMLVSGFTTAASLYVFTSQLPFLFGIEMPHRSGPLALLYAYADLSAKVLEANPVTVCISVTCCIILLFFKIYVNGKIRQRFKIDIPFPIELILVIIGTVASCFLDLEVRDVKIVGVIPSGLPAPQMPDWSLLLLLAKKSIPLAIVAYTLTISVGKIFAARHRYEIDANQELLALGTLNLFSCFFSCLPSAASLSRSAVQESAGGKTQVVSIINCIGILFVLYFAGSLLEKLPICILACIIAVALKSLFAQVTDFVRYWRVSKLDASIWLVTFVSVLLLDVDLGLYVGLGYSLLTLIYKSQRPKTYLLGSVGASDVYVPERKYNSARPVPGILIYQFCGPLHFANTEFFLNDLTSKTGVSVPSIQKQMQHQLRQQEKQRKPELPALIGKQQKRSSTSGSRNCIRALCDEEDVRKSNMNNNLHDLESSGGGRKTGFHSVVGDESVELTKRNDGYDSNDDEDSEVQTVTQLCA